MISSQDKEKIVEISRKFGIKKVLLFGSSLDEGDVANDIDIAVEGAPPRDFFKYYAELLFSLSKPVDLIELKKNDRLSAYISRKAPVLYE